VVDPQLPHSLPLRLLASVAFPVMDMGGRVGEKSDFFAISERVRSLRKNNYGTVEIQCSAHL
jgi:hypothetical protein